MFLKCFIAVESNSNFFAVLADVLFDITEAAAC